MQPYVMINYILQPTRCNVSWI